MPELGPALNVDLDQCLDEMFDLLLLACAGDDLNVIADPSDLPVKHYFAAAGYLVWRAGVVVDRRVSYLQGE